MYQMLLLCLCHICYCRACTKPVTAVLVPDLLLQCPYQTCYCSACTRPVSAVPIWNLLLPCLYHICYCRACTRPVSVVPVPDLLLPFNFCPYITHSILKASHQPLLLFSVYSRLLVVRWRSAGNSAPQQDTHQSRRHPNTLRMVSAPSPFVWYLIYVLFDATYEVTSADRNTM